MKPSTVVFIALGVAVAGFGVYMIAGNPNGTSTPDTAPTAGQMITTTKVIHGQTVTASFIVNSDGSQTPVHRG